MLSLLVRSFSRHVPTSLFFFLCEQSVVIYFTDDLRKALRFVFVFQFPQCNVAFDKYNFADF